MQRCKCLTCLTSSCRLQVALTDLGYVQRPLNTNKRVEAAPPLDSALHDAVATANGGDGHSRLDVASAQQLDYCYSRL